MTEGVNGAGHNAKARKKVIVNTIRRLEALEAERKLVSEQIAEIKAKEIKGDLGMKITDFNVARRLYALEGEDRRELFATLRETFSALGAGDQLDFIDAMRGEKGEGAPA
jgi:uncharacterized protein (UPF0335 family)